MDPEEAAKNARKGVYENVAFFAVTVVGIKAGMFSLKPKQIHVVSHVKSTHVGYSSTVI